VGNSSQAPRAILRVGLGEADGDRGQSSSSRFGEIAARRRWTEPTRSLSCIPGHAGQNTAPQARKAGRSAVFRASAVLGYPPASREEQEGLAFAPKKEDTLRGGGTKGYERLPGTMHLYCRVRWQE
jgi:hypothetical protein